MPPSRLVSVSRAALLALVLAVGLLVAAPVERAAAAGAAVTGVGSGLCLDVSGGSGTAGAGTILWGCHGRSNQQWSLTPAGELRVYGDTLCLQAQGGATAPGTRSVTAACTGAAGQRWRYTAQRTLVDQRSGLCLDARGGATVAGTEVMLYTCHGRSNQQWTGLAIVADTTPPTPPTALRASGLTCSTVTLAWSAATDALGVTAYDVYHDGQLVTSVGGGTRQVQVAVVPRVTWGWYVNARDAAGNVSQASATVPVTPPDCVQDTTAPTVPGQVRAVATGTSVTVSWSASTDALGVSAYDVLRDGAVASSVPGATTTFVDSGLAAGRTYSYAVVARDAQGNASARSAAATVTTGVACGSPICGVTEVATDTDIPWGLVTLPDGSVLYARRDAHDVVRLDPATGAKRTVGAFADARSTDGEGGLMGLAVAPDFAADPWLYVMYTTATDNRVVRVRYVNGSLDPASTQVLLSGILRNKYHNGGRLRFGPDGMLYVATGDAQNQNYAQALTGTGALNGKILRMTRTGGVPADNPFGSYVWSYGHRNPQGLAFDSQGRLWQQEFGNSVMDETNLVRRGGNYGWPQCEGTSGSGCGNAGLVAPALTYSTATGSCSGLTVVRDVVFVACGRGSRLYRAVITGDRLTDVQQYFVGTYGRLRTVEPAPDGDLWLTTTNQGDKDSIANNSAERILRVDLSG